MVDLCRLCAVLMGDRSDMPAHAPRQHQAVFADSAVPGRAGVPAWEAIISEPLPDGWEAPPGGRNLDVFIAALPKGTTVLWWKVRWPA